MSDAQEPEELSVHIKAFAAIISNGPLGLALYRPQAWAQPGLCFENARRQVQQRGGQVLFGWMFHHRLVADIPGPGYLIAAHHAVWHAQSGQLVDVTPFHEDIKHRPIAPNGDVLLLVDVEAHPIRVGQVIGPRPSKFYAILPEERIAGHVRRLQEDEEVACRKLFQAED